MLAQSFFPAPHFGQRCDALFDSVPSVVQRRAAIKELSRLSWSQYASTLAALGAAGHRNAVSRFLSRIDALVPVRALTEHPGRVVGGKVANCLQWVAAVRDLMILNHEDDYSAFGGTEVVVAYVDTTELRAGPVSAAQGAGTEEPTLHSTPVYVRLCNGSRGLTDEHATVLLGHMLDKDTRRGLARMWNHFGGDLIEMFTEFDRAPRTLGLLFVDGGAISALCGLDTRACELCGLPRGIIAHGAPSTGRNLSPVQYPFCPWTGFPKDLFPNGSLKVSSVYCARARPEP